jgi:hypothetical protein
MIDRMKKFSRGDRVILLGKKRRTGTVESVNAAGTLRVKLDKKEGRWEYSYSASSWAEPLIESEPPVSNPDTE